MSFYLKEGEILWPTAEGTYDVRNKLPTGTYTVGAHPARGFYLKPISDFDISGKIYGKTSKQAERILSTFAARPNSTGVLLSGEKGSGKTMLAKLVSQKAAMDGISTLVINTPFTGDAFNTFIQSINEPCIIVFDEFEKVFDEKEQEATLTLLDGVYPTKKLFILTCNDRYRVNSHMTNRPGRIFYFLEFKGLDVAFIEEYCRDRLDDKKHIQQICRLSMLYASFNFDMLKALIEEMNRYNETPNEALEMLNAKPFSGEDSTHYDAKIIIDGLEVAPSRINSPSMRGNPVSRGNYSFWVDELPKDGQDVDDVNQFEVEIRPDNLKKIDPEKGTFTYYIEGETNIVVILTRESVKAAYDWRSAF